MVVSCGYVTSSALEKVSNFKVYKYLYFFLKEIITFSRHKKKTSLIRKDMIIEFLVSLRKVYPTYCLEMHVICEKRGDYN